LVKTEATVEVRPRGELAGLGLANARNGAESFDHPVYKRRIAGEEELGGILSGV
jgi:hypothetical protein